MLSIQFGIVYGHREGSGSLGNKGVTDRTTKQGYLVNLIILINPPETTNFTFQGNTTTKTIYMVSVNRN